MLSRVSTAAQVADFGLSQYTTDTVPTDSSDPVGTLSVMAPELIRGDVIASWQAVDSYGVGCIAHDVAHINTGGTAPALSPDDGSVDSADEQNRGLSVAALMAAAFPGSEHATRLRPVDARVPQLLARVIHTCLAEDPSARPDMTAVRRMLSPDT